MTKAIWINAIGFNLIWLGLIHFGNAFIPVALVLLYIHCKYLVKSKTEYAFIALLGVIGLCLDSFLTYQQVFIFTNQHGITLGFIPLWLFVLWLLFAATINHSLNFLQNSKLMQFAAGAILAPLSYLAGFHLEAVNFGQPLLVTYLTLSIIWGPLFLITFYLNQVLKEIYKHNGVETC